MDKYSGVLHLIVVIRQNRITGTAFPPVYKNNCCSTNEEANVILVDMALHKVTLTMYRMPACIGHFLCWK